MGDLGDKPVDPIDLASMCELMLIPSSREERRWISTQSKFSKPFMSELAGILIGEGHQLGHWNGLEDTVSDPNNKSGVNCIQCDCIA